MPGSLSYLHIYYHEVVGTLMHHEEIHHGIDSANINLFCFIHIAITEHV